LQSSDPISVTTTVVLDGLPWEQADSGQANDSRLQACGATQLASNPAPTSLTLLHGTSGLAEASAHVEALTESPAKSLRPGATVLQSLRANAVVSTPSTAHLQTQVSNHMTNILGIQKTWQICHVTWMMSKPSVLWASSPLQLPVMHWTALVDELRLLEFSLNIS